MAPATYRGTPIAGSTVFTTERSRKGYRINKLAMSLTDPANRERFKADEKAYMAEYGLTAIGAVQDHLVSTDAEYSFPWQCCAKEQRLPNWSRVIEEVLRITDSPAQMRRK